MEAHWEAFETEIDGIAACIVYNETAARELPQLDLPNLLRVQVAFEPGPGILPDGEEEERLSALEQELESWIGAIGGRYVAQVTIRGLRTMFFHVACGREEAENLVRRIAIRRDIEIGLRMEADPRYRTYYELLLPTAEERRRMETMARIADLVARGDDLEKARPVSHEASFANRHQAIAFANWARKNGFMVDGILSPGAGRESFVLQFHRTMAPQPQALEADVEAIAHMAGQLGGAYEGWSAPARVPVAV